MSNFCGLFACQRSALVLLLAAAGLVVLLGHEGLAQVCPSQTTYGTSGLTDNSTAQSDLRGSIFIQVSPAIPCNGYLKSLSTCLRATSFPSDQDAFQYYLLVLRQTSDGVFDLIHFASGSLAGVGTERTVCQPGSSLSSSMNNDRIIVEQGDLVATVLPFVSSVFGYSYNTSLPSDMIQTCSNAASDGSFQSTNSGSFSGSLTDVTQINCSVGGGLNGLSFFRTSFLLDLKVEIDPLEFPVTSSAMLGVSSSTAVDRNQLSPSAFFTVQPSEVTTRFSSSISTPSPSPSPSPLPSLSPSPSPSPLLSLSPLPSLSPSPSPSPSSSQTTTVGTPGLTSSPPETQLIIIGCSVGGALLLLIAVLLCLICCVFCIRRRRSYGVVKQSKKKESVVSGTFSLNGMTLSQGDVLAGSLQPNGENVLMKNGTVSAFDRESRMYESLVMQDQSTQNGIHEKSERNGNRNGNSNGYNVTASKYEQPQASMKASDNQCEEPLQCEGGEEGEEEGGLPYATFGDSTAGTGRDGTYEQPRESMAMFAAYARSYETPQTALEEYRKSRENLADILPRDTIYETPTSDTMQGKTEAGLISTYEQFTSSSASRVPEVSEHSEDEEDGKDREDGTPSTEENIYWQPPSTEEEIYETLRRKSYTLIGESEVKIVTKLGEGHFAKVHLGLWTRRGKSLQVAVKRLKPGANSDHLRVKFLQEAATMAQFKHPHVVDVHGVVNTAHLTSPCAIIMEYMLHGDLKKHLRSLKERLVMGGEDPSRVSEDLLRFALEIASAMNYLANRGYVHRDVAARNILLDDAYVSKIGDFGLSRSLEDSGYYKSEGGRIPVKWTAPEALGYKKYTQASDVWSYGCLLYEMWSLGEAPLYGVKKEYVVQELLRGYRSAPPPGCPRKMYELMLNCWHSDPLSRPLFSEMYSLLDSEGMFLLTWEDSDLLQSPQEALKLGSPLSHGCELYKDIQEVYVAR